MEDGIATCNAELEAGSIRRETHAGRDHLVAPVVAVREMVLKGEFLPTEAIANSQPAWNGRVLPIGHPTDENGEFLSANSPEVHDAQSVGKFFGAEAADSALTGEIWVDIERSKSLYESTDDERFVKPLAILASHAGDEAANAVGELDVALNDGDLLEVSTAYFYQREDALGTHDGQSYEATQSNIRPDHLALLPNSVGECSVEDGCGAPRMHVHADVGSGGSSDGEVGDEETDAGFGDTHSGGEQQTLTNFSEMSDQIEWLAEHTEFDAETLAGFEDSHLKTLRASVDDMDGEHNGECQCNECTDTESNEQNNDDGVSDEVSSELAALREQVSELESQVNAEDEKRCEAALEEIREHSSYDGNNAGYVEYLESFTDPEPLEELAAEIKRSASADFGGRVGAHGAPNDSGSESDDYLEIAMEANESRFGSPADGDGGD